MTQIYRISITIHGVVFSPELGQSAHSRIPTCSRNLDVRTGIDKQRDRSIVPGTSQPHIGFGRIAWSCDDIVHEHISPGCLLWMIRSNDVTSTLAHDINGILVQIDISLTIDKVYSTFYPTVLYVMTIIEFGGSKPCVLIREQAHLVKCHTVAQGIERQSLWTIIFLHAIRVDKVDTLKVEIVRIGCQRGAIVHLIGIVTST